MYGRAKIKGVTSGRLTGKPQKTRTGPPDWSEPVYSLYSTDSEEQVTTLHKGLDHCAALLSGILQEDEAASTGRPRTVKNGAAKTRNSTSMGKKTLKKLPVKTASPGRPRAVNGWAAKSRPTASQGTVALKKLPRKTDQKSSRPDLRGAGGGLTPKRQQSSVPAAHSGVKLHPPRKRAQELHERELQGLWNSVSTPHTGLVSEASRRRAEPETEEELVPVRDSDTRDTHVDTHDLERPVVETEAKTEMVRYLLGELKALIAGQGSVAERLLSHLEETVSGAPDGPGSAYDLSAADGPSARPCRCGGIQNEQLKERENLETPQKQETACNWGVRDDLVAVQLRLRELREEFAELRKAHEDTQSHLRNVEAENALLKTDLEATRSRLLECEKQKGELASLAQKRLEEIGNPKSFFQVQRPADDHSFQPLAPNRRFGADPEEPSTDRIKQYLTSLSQTQHGGASPERGDSTREPGDASPRPQCDLESLWSDRSAWSASTFDTRDEAAFRDGLAALDASIASLQKTIRLDLRLQPSASM
ncbi:uncharacterized protein ccdc14 [Menidia menidia]|uniref:(Atlantic silverside) hypothetical protein n=1 Tax=Menidia menidia TaxID=238744 RepID=A0A8S4B9L0_9TELE|nr:unnamed protein product [Menidia menidia]